jgi:hypothetical protein
MKFFSMTLIVSMLPGALLLGQKPPATDSPTGAPAVARKAPDLSSVPAPRLHDGKPDFSGIWLSAGPIDDLADGLPKGEKIPLLASAEKVMQARQSKDDPEANCLPTGVPRVAPYPWTFAVAPGRWYILFEGNIHSYRQIFMDGREHPKDLNPTWYGHSVGRWEGDTLVIDTVGFNDKFWFDFRGHPHTEQLHTIERYTRKDFETMVNEITIDDPGAYSRPFKVTFNARIMPEGEILEYICQENNRDLSHILGPAGPGGGEILPPGKH